MEGEDEFEGMVPDSVLRAYGSSCEPSEPLE